MATISPAGIARIKRYEALSLVTYDDQAGLATIGWGHLIKPGEDFSAGLTHAQAEELLAADLAPRVAALDAMFEVEITQDQFDSCASLLFNIGEGAFRNSSFLRAINARENNSAIVDALRKWCKITDPKTGKLVPSKGLALRRSDEAKAWP